MPIRSRYELFRTYPCHFISLKHLLEPAIASRKLALQHPSQQGGQKLIEAPYIIRPMIDNLSSVALPRKRLTLQKRKGLLSLDGKCLVRFISNYFACGREFQPQHLRIDRRFRANSV